MPSAWTISISAVPARVAIVGRGGYSLSMNDAPRHTRSTLPADPDPPMPGEAELLTALSESEAEAEVGLFVSGDELMRELHESIARMESRAEALHADTGSPPRR
jgi:hypothetical protein